LLAWLGLAAYVELNKKELLEKAKTAFRSRVGGEAEIGALDISFFRHFPSITVRLSAVTLRDSAWQQHHHDLLKAGDVFLSCNLLKSLLTRRVQLGRIDLEHGQVYFYTDSSGYSNTYLLRDRHPDNAGKSADPPDIGITDMHWVMERQDKHKLFDLDIKRLFCSITKTDDRQLHLAVDPDILVNSFAFNTEKGSFIKGKKLTGSFVIDYNTASKIVQFNKATVRIDGHPFVFTGRFFPSVAPDPFILSIETENVLFRQVTALLTPNLQQKLDQYDIDRPLTIHAQLDAGAADDPEPQIQVRTAVENASVETPPGRFTEATFKASFTNEWVHGQKRGDENSGIRLLAFTCRLLGLPLRSDSIVITNLKHPQASCDLHSYFGLALLNDITGSQTLQFTGGSGKMDLIYKGPLSENDTAGTAVNGSLDLDSAALTYLPYQFRLTEGKGRLLFNNQDLLIDQLLMQVGTSRVRIKGIAKNLIALLDRNAENVGVDLSLSTPRLELEDVVTLAGQSQPSKSKSKGNSVFGATFSRIDHLLKEGAIHVGLEADNISYKKFTGAHAKADLVFDDHQIRLSRLTVEQGAGSMELKAVLNRQGQGGVNPLTLESHLEGVDLPKIFTAFNDFGQDAITAKNLKGTLTADIHVNGALTNKVKVAPKSLKGTINFTIRDGQLVDFSPIAEIHQKALKNRDLSDVRFTELKDELDVDSTTITVHRMEINSTAFTLFVEGTYDLKTGTDMSLQIPLRNLSKDRDQDIPPESRGNDGKAGLSVRLRAKTGPDGKLKISWDPFKKALKKVKEKPAAS
jgi:AsmA-like C-terminal region